MPCDSSYLEQTRREAELQRAAKLLKYLLRERGKGVPAWVFEQAEKYYADDERSVPMLCEELKSCTEAELDRIVYNARNPVARDLAAWWEEHQQADYDRLLAEGVRFQGMVTE